MAFSPNRNSSNPIIPALFAIIALSMSTPESGAQAPAGADTRARLAAIRTAIGRGGVGQAAAIADLVVIEWGDPADPDAELVAEICGAFEYAIGRSRGGVRMLAVKRLCAQDSRFEGASRDVILECVQESLSRMLIREGALIEREPALALVECMLRAGHGDGLRLARELASVTGAWSDVFALLARLSRPDTLDALGAHAGTAAGRSLKIRTEAMAALGRFGEGAPQYRIRVPALLEALDSAATRETAIAALKTLCFPDFDKPSDWANWWKTRAGAADSDVLMADFDEALGKESAPSGRGVDAICEWLRGKSDPLFAWAAPAAVALLQHANDPLRESAVHALSGMGALEALEPMLGMISGADDGARSGAAFACALIRGCAKLAASGAVGDREKAAAVFARRLDSLREEIRAEAAAALGAVGGRAFSTELAAALDDTSYAVAARAAESLGAMKAAEAMDAMLEALARCVRDDRRWVAGIGIVRGLRSMDMRTPAAVEALVAAISSPQDELCSEAVGLAGAHWRAPEAFQAVFAVTEDASRGRSCRLAAMVAVSEYPQYASGPAMARALRQPDATLDEAALGGDAARAERDLRKQFFEIAAGFFTRSGGADPMLRGDLIEAIGDREANPGGRVIALGLVAAPAVWDARQCLDAVAGAAGDPAETVFRAAFAALKRHPSEEAFETLLGMLPGKGAAVAGNRERCAADVLDSYLDCWSRIDRVRGNHPRFGSDRKAWESWWRRHKGEFVFPD